MEAFQHKAFGQQAVVTCIVCRGEGSNMFMHGGRIRFGQAVATGMLESVCRLARKCVLCIWNATQTM